MIIELPDTPENKARRDLHKVEKVMRDPTHNAIFGPFVADFVNPEGLAEILMKIERTNYEDV